MITLKRFRRLEAALRRQGLGPVIAWSETISAPKNADEFAARTAYVILCGGMTVTAASAIYQRCIGALQSGGSVCDVFAHPGKGPAIDSIWQDRERIYAGYCEAHDKLAFLQALPWIGPVTRHHLAKNLGEDEAKPDVHLERLARREKTTTRRLCERLARQTGYRIATVDTILWRACADRLLRSKQYERDGWTSAISKDVTHQEWLPGETEHAGKGPTVKNSVS